MRVVTGCLWGKPTKSAAPTGSVGRCDLNVKVPCKLHRIRQSHLQADWCLPRNPEGNSCGCNSPETSVVLGHTSLFGTPVQCKVHNQVSCGRASAQLARRGSSQLLMALGLKLVATSVSLTCLL